MEEQQETKKRLKERYGLSIRQASSVMRLLECYNIPEKAAILELSYREEFKAKRNEKLLKMFGKGKNYQEYVEHPLIDIEQDE